MILYRDDEICVVDKPSGLLVHSRPENRGERCLMKIVRNRINRFVYPVHRLDRGTSGVMVFALSPEIARQLALQFEARTVEKVYWAVCRGYTSSLQAIDRPLGSSSGKSKTALTQVETLSTAVIPVCIDRYPSSRYSLISASPKSGRYHQIRRHLAQSNHPIIGDGQHGAHRHNTYFGNRWEKRLLLFSRRLRFQHPLTGSPCQFKAPISPSLQPLFSDLGWQDLFAGKSI